MKTCATLVSVAALSLSFLSLQLIADEKSADQKTNSARTHHFRTSTIEGMAVRNSKGDDLGKVKDVVIDLETGAVVYAALDFGGFIGIGDKLFAVPWNAFKCETKGKVEYLLLDIPKEKLTNAPGFDKSHWPVAGDPAWSQIDKFYGRLKTTQESTKPATLAHARLESAAIPESLMKPKLSSEQDEQIKGIIGSYDESLHKVWKQFGDRYLQTIAMESTMLAAIEDNLTEAQRQKVREQRHKTAQYEKAAAATNDKPNLAPAKPASGAEDAIADAGVLLTAEQEAAADKIQEKYRSQLRSLNRDIQGLHIRLVSLEADKLVAIEKVLTKDQLAQLRLNRQTAPVSTKLEISSTESKNTE